MLSNNWLNYQIMADLLRKETYCNDLTYKDYGTSRINNNINGEIKQSDFLYCNVHANKAVKNTVEQKKLGEKLLRGRIYYVDGGDFITFKGRLYYARGEAFSWGRLYRMAPATKWKKSKEARRLANWHWSFVIETVKSPSYLQQSLNDISCVCKTLATDDNVDKWQHKP